MRQPVSAHASTTPCGMCDGRRSLGTSTNELLVLSTLFHVYGTEALCTCSVQLVALLGTESAGEHSTVNFVPPALGRRPLELDRKNGTWVTVIAWVL